MTFSPRLSSTSASIWEAGEMAAEALALHIEGLAEDGGEIPVPSSADAVLAHPDAADALALLVVEPLPARAETPVSR